jgi:hypothetical protein
MHTNLNRWRGKTRKRRNAAHATWEGGRHPLPGLAHSGNRNWPGHGASERELTTTPPRRVRPGFGSPPASFRPQAGSAFYGKTLDYRSIMSLQGSSGYRAPSAHCEVVGRHFGVTSRQSSPRASTRGLTDRPRPHLALS